MPDDAPAASDRPPQQPTAAESLKKLRTRLSGFRAHWQGCRKDAARDKYDADVMEAFCRDLDQLDALAADGCRAAGAATPLATSDQDRLRKALETIKATISGYPNWRDWMGERLAVGNICNDVLSVGAGAATPALTAAERHWCDRIRGWQIDGTAVTPAEAALADAVDRLTATAATAGVAAAPSPAATPTASETK